MRVAAGANGPRFVAASRMRGDRGASPCSPCGRSGGASRRDSSTPSSAVRRGPCLVGNSRGMLMPSPHSSRGAAMSPTLESLGIDQLNAEDRLALAEAIWESVAREMEQDSLPEGQRKELERRLADSIARPDAVTPWE